MFTGLIRDVGRLASVTGNGADCELTIETALNPAHLQPGASVACNGVCLTVTKLEASRFHAMASAETLAKTTIGSWEKGRAINLEPSLRMGDELGGHLVYGHVDATLRCLARMADGQSLRFRFELPRAVAPYVASKGSVALDGVSLTVNEVDAEGFGVNIIPFTAAHTGFGALQAGDRVNFEIDMLARYVARLAESRAA